MRPRPGGYFDVWELILYVLVFVFMMWISWDAFAEVNPEHQYPNCKTLQTIQAGLLSRHYKAGTVYISRNNWALQVFNHPGGGWALVRTTPQLGCSQIIDIGDTVLNDEIEKEYW